MFVRALQGRNKPPESPSPRPSPPAPPARPPLAPPKNTQTRVFPFPGNNLLSSVSQFQTPLRHAARRHRPPPPHRPRGDRLRHARQQRKVSPPASVPPQTRAPRTQRPAPLLPERRFSAAVPSRTPPSFCAPLSRLPAGTPATPARPPLKRSRGAPANESAPGSFLIMLVTVFYSDILPAGLRLSGFLPPNHQRCGSAATLASPPPPRCSSPA